MNCKKLFQLRPVVQRLVQPARYVSNQPSETRVERTVNQVNLMGRVGADPQKRGSEDHPVVLFSLATHFNYKDGSGDLLQKSEWHRICVFKNGLRENVYRFLHKGQRVYVTGRLTYGEVKDETGSVRVTTAIVADDVIFLQDKNPKDQDSKDS